MAGEIRTILIAGFPVDVARTETHAFEAEVTEHPVESGSDVTDNVRAKPIEVTLECIVSDTPIGDIANDPTRQLDLIEIDGELEDPTAPLPSDDAYSRLKAILMARQPVTISTSLDTFENMVLTKLSVPRSASTSGGLTFEATFLQITIVENRRTTIRVAPPTGGPSGDKKNKLGLSLTKISNGKDILWRKGKPPGSNNIVGQEVLTRVEDQQTGSNTTEHQDRLVHKATGKSLTPTEAAAYRLDIEREGRAGAERAFGTGGTGPFDALESENPADTVDNSLWFSGD